MYSVYVLCKCRGSTQERDSPSEWRPRYLNNNIIMASDESGSSKSEEAEPYLGPPSLKKQKLLSKEVAASLRRDYIS